MNIKRELLDLPVTAAGHAETLHLLLLLRVQTPHLLISLLAVNAQLVVRQIQ